MTRSQDRIVVLLGAGASADAGLPLTSGLARLVVERANDLDKKRRQLPPGPPGFVTALNAVYASMVGHQGQRGSNPLTAVNIETLISAVRLLQDRDHHEVAPFVSAWSAALSDFPSTDLPSESGRKIADAIGRGMLDGHSDYGAIAEHVAIIARAALRPDLSRPFREAEQFVLHSLVDILSAFDDVDYLTPLVDLARTQKDGLDVITLNYDLTVERAATEHGVEVARGIEDWQPGAPIDLPPRQGVLNLLKLHGSLDWRREHPELGVSPLLAPPRLRVIEPQTTTDDARVEDLPWIVVGDREKLATDGPTLALLFAAGSALQRGTHLAVVGYSFGDAHINAMIRDWLAADPRRTISVLDKQWERRSSWERAEDFKTVLINAYGRDRTGFQEPLQPRLVAIEGTTGTSLAQALVARPAPTPAELVSVVAERLQGSLKVRVTWHGDNLVDVHVTARPPGRSGLPQKPIHLHEDETLEETRFAWFEGLNIAALARGATVEVFVSSTTSLPFEISVSGTTLTGGGYGTAVVAP
nr:SIR2 family protein [Microbacterium testaceum]